MSFRPRTAAPADLVLDSIERLFRYGYSTHLTNTTDWTTGKCPAGHWILQEGTTFHRTDEPGDEVRPALILGTVEGIRPLYDNAREVWEVPIFIEIRYSRNYAPDEAQTLMQQLESVITHGITPDTSTFIAAKTILSAAVSGSTPGLNVLHVHEVVSQPFRSAETGGATILTLECTIRCSGIAPA